MSHHFDGPTAIVGGRINLCEFYVFPAAPGTAAPTAATVAREGGRWRAGRRFAAGYAFLTGTLPGQTGTCPGSE